MRALQVVRQDPKSQSGLPGDLDGSGFNDPQVTVNLPLSRRACDLLATLALPRAALLRLDLPESHTFRSHHLFPRWRFPFYSGSCGSICTVCLCKSY